MGNEIITHSWEECEEQIRQLERDNKKSSQPLLFRGQADAHWLLQTTLERKDRAFTSVEKYYRLTRRIKPTIESLTDSDWELPDYFAIRKWVDDYEHQWEQEEIIPGYSYLAHLRHHGFPSPLLDWSRSHYVAAYFAFKSPLEAEFVAIYALSETPKNMKSSSSREPQVKVLGPYIKTHPRHFRQQASYTICRTFENKRWEFTPHQRVLDVGNQQQDVLYKIKIPGSERLKVLTYLDKLNLNAYSLFNSEESLMETLAFREMV
jgi:hypothetical protein